MPPLLAAQILAQIGTTGLPLLAKLLDDFRAARTVTTITPEDVLELDRLSKQDSDSIYAKLGITPPPAAAPTAV